MSYTSRVLIAMREGQEYSPSEIATITKIQEDDVGKSLHLLSKGGGSGVCFF